MKTIAIISFFHAESSLCLAKYLAKQDCKVEYYYVTNLLHGKRSTAGFEFFAAKKRLGNYLLKRDEAPEVYRYMEGLPVSLYLMQIVHYDRYPRFHKWFFKYLMWQIRRKRYDAINVVGQYSWVEYVHEELKDENLVHTFHEIGNHSGNLKPLRIVETAIKDKTKVILHSNAVFHRFCTIPNVDKSKTKMIPFGKFETLRLYVKEDDIILPFNKEKPILLFYGMIYPYKGLDVLAKSLELIKQDWDKFNIIIAGGGIDDNLPYFAAMPNSYIINRYLSNDEMMNLIRQSSAILLPYKRASQTGIIPTCVLYGKPFIATNVGAFSESVIDGYNGLLVEPENPQAFAEAVKTIIHNPDFLVHLSDGAKNYGIGDSFDWNEIAKQTINYIYKV